MLDETLKSADNIEEAIEIEETENDLDSLFMDAKEMFDAGKFSSSKDILNSIISQDKNHVNAMALMAKILYEQEQFDVSGYFIKKVLNLDKSNEIANELDMLLNKNEENVSESTAIGSLDDIDTLYEEAYDLYGQGDLETASEILEKIIGFDEKNVDALALMGHVMYDSRIYPKAIEYLKKASKVDKNNEMVRELKMRLA